jgi:SprT-like protein
MLMLTQAHLERYANHFLKNNYGFGLSIPLQINGRLKSTQGKFTYVKYKSGKPSVPKHVQLSKALVENNPDSIVLDVLAHELIHYALFMKGLPHSDGHPTFENELKRLGIVSQDTIDKYAIAERMQIYGCSQCPHEYKMRRRLKNNGINHRCKCGGRLIDKGKKVMTV